MDQHGWLAEFLAFPEADKLEDSERALTHLRPEWIKTHKTLFQPRQFLYNNEASIVQVATLKKAIKRNRTVGKLLVWKAGGQWYCIDGHHRLEAYREVIAKDAKWRERLVQVPVRIFRGSKQEAHERSIAENAEDKLPTTFGDKLEAAWRMVLQGPDAYTVERIAELTQVGARTVKEMRSLRRDALAGRLPLTLLNPAEHTWRVFKDILNGLKPKADQDVKDQEQRDSYRRQINRLAAPLQGRRRIRLFMEELGHLSLSVLETAVAEGQLRLKELQRLKYKEGEADFEDSRPVEEDDEGHERDSTEF